MPTDRIWNFKTIRALTIWTLSFLVACVALGAVTTACDVTGTLMFADWNDMNAPFSGSAELALSGLMALAALIQIPLFITTIVLVCMWMYRAAANIRALGEDRANITPGWAAGWWFVPFANLVMPFRAMREIYVSSQGAVTGDNQSLDNTPALIGWWWAFWLLDNFVANASMRMTFRSDPGMVELGVWIGAIAMLLDITAAVLVFSILRRVAGWQMLAAATEPSVARRACVGCGYDLSGTPGRSCPECGQLLPDLATPLPA